MKKILIILLLVIGILLFSKKEYYGDDAIRFRVISNSNSSRDIFMKEMVVNKISGYVFNDYEDKEITRKNIISNISNIEEEIDRLFKNNNYDMDYKVNYGMNYFPVKKYDGVTYKEGNYESLVVSIGKAKGNNYWCILYPPLCMIDDNKSEEVKYDFKILELFKKIF